MLKRSNINQISYLGSEQQGAELVGKDFLRKIRARRRQRALPAAVYLAGSNLILRCRCQTVRRNSQKGRRRPRCLESSGQDFATSRGVVNRQTSVSWASRRILPSRRIRSTGEALANRSRSSRFVIGSSQRKYGNASGSSRSEEEARLMLDPWSLSSCRTPPTNVETNLSNHNLACSSARQLERPGGSRGRDPGPGSLASLLSAETPAE